MIAVRFRTGAFGEKSPHFPIKRLPLVGGRTPLPTYANGYKQAVLKTDEPKGLWVRILPLAFKSHIAHVI